MLLEIVVVYYHDKHRRFIFNEDFFCLLNRVFHCVSRQNVFDGMFIILFFFHNELNNSARFGNIKIELIVFFFIINSSLF